MITDTDWKSLKVGDKVILFCTGKPAKITEVNPGISITVDLKFHSCPIYYQYEVKEKV